MILEELVLVSPGIQTLAGLGQVHHVADHGSLHVIPVTVVDSDEVLDVMVIRQVHTIHQLLYFFFVMFTNTLIGSLGTQDMDQLRLKGIILINSAAM